MASGEGIRISGAQAGFQQEVIGNAVFAGTALQGGSQTGNVTGTYAAAGNYLTNPDGALSGPDRLELFPLAGTLSGSALDLSNQQGFEDWDRDFNGQTGVATWRGAYAGDDANPGWQPALEIKPDPLALFADGFESGDTSAWSATVP